MQTSEEFQAWRASTGLSRAEVAKELGISFSLVRAIEAGTRRLTKTLALAIVGWQAQQVPSAPSDDLTADERQQLRALLARLATTPAQPPVLAPVRPAIPLSAVDDASMRERMERKIAELGALDDE